MIDEEVISITLLVITVVHNILLAKMFFNFTERFRQLEEDFMKMRNENFALLGTICGKLYKEENNRER